MVKQVNFMHMIEFLRDTQIPKEDAEHEQWAKEPELGTSKTALTIFFKLGCINPSFQGMLKFKCFKPALNTKIAS